MDDGTGESSNFKKLEEGFRSFVVIEKKKYSCLFVANCTHNHVITYLQKFCCHRKKKYSCLFVANCTHNHVITYVLKVFYKLSKVTDVFT